MSNQLNELKKLPILSLRFSLICVVEKDIGIRKPIEIVNWSIIEPS